MRSFTAAVATAFAVAAAPAVAQAAPATAAAAAAEARAEAAIAAFEETVTDAGFEDDGHGLLSGPLDVFGPDDDELGHCLTDLADLYDDERLRDVALASAPSQDFFLPPDGEPLDTDDWESYRYFDNVFAEVFVVADEDADALDVVVETLGSDEVAECLEDTLRDLLNSEDELSGSVTVSAERDDVRAWLEVASSFTRGDEDVEFTIHLGFARVGDALATVGLSVSETDADAGVAEDALDAMIASLSQ